MVCVFPGLVKPACISDLSSVKPGLGGTSRWRCSFAGSPGEGGRAGGDRETEDRRLLPCPDPGVRVRKEERDASESGLVSPSQLASTLALPRKSAARQLTGHEGSSQLCVERHQMVCYETHFGQKIAGVFGSWEDNKAREKGGVSWERQEREATLASGLVLLCTLPLPHSGPVSSVKRRQNSPNQVSVLGATRCPWRHGELALRDTHADKAGRVGTCPTNPGRREGWGTLTEGSHTQMIPLLQSDSGDPWAASHTGSEHRWGPSAGTSGPSCGRADRKLSATQHHRGAPGGHTCRVCFKVPATRCLWSGAAPPSGSPGVGAQAQACWAPAEGTLEDAALS